MTQPNQMYYSNQPYTTLVEDPKPTQSPTNYIPMMNDVKIPTTKETIPQKSLTQNYYNKKIVNSTSPVLRTPLIGPKEMAETEFDDYFEKHASKFFTPEVDQVHLYYTPDYLLGLQFCYRDSWGRGERENYKGNLHMNKFFNPKEFPCVSMKLEFDELIKEIYVEGSSTHVTYIKLVTNKAQKVEFGSPSGAELKNLLPDLSNLVAVGGSYGTCISNIYFYYS